MKTQETTTVPDSTYFRTGDAEPTIEADGSITILNGRGTRRSWGAPQVNTTILIDDCDFLAVLVGFSHKHGGSQFYRYYIQDGNDTRRVTWASLTDDERQMVLGAYDEKAPHWAKKPGKLRSEYRKPTSEHFTAYKVMRKVSDTEFLSLYDDTEWTLGKRNGEAVDPRAGMDYYYGDSAFHGGGFYVHKDETKIVILWDAGKLGKRREGWTHVLVECDCYGRVAEFSSGKLAVTYCTPVSVIREL